MDRVLEITAHPGDAHRLARLAAALPGAHATAAGLEVALSSDRSPEEILALCQARRIAVRATAVHHRPSGRLVRPSGRLVRQALGSR